MTVPTMAEELWRKYQYDGWIGPTAFDAAINEACAAVRARDAEKAGRADTEYQATKDAHERNTNEPFDPDEYGFNMDVIEHSRYVAAAIAREELP